MEACIKHFLSATMQRFVIQQMSGIASGWMLQYVMVRLDGQLDGIQSTMGTNLQACAWRRLDSRTKWGGKTHWRFGGFHSVRGISRLNKLGSHIHCSLLPDCGCHVLSSKRWTVSILRVWDKINPSSLKLYLAKYLLTTVSRRVTNTKKCACL